MLGKVQIIAEVKIQSPFGFKSSEKWDDLFKLAEEIGDIISIHTDSRWGGSFDLIAKARKMTSKPILAKGIHSNDSDIIKAIENGADLVLVVGRIPEIYQEKCLIEPLNLEELSKIPSDFKVVWNSRDLSSGKLKKETFEQARELWDGWLCQASNVKSFADIKKGADAVLVGANLREFANSLARIS